VVKPKIKERRSKKWQTESKEHQFFIEMTSCVYGNFEISSVYPSIETIISEKLKEITV